ncbi:HAD family hydrolase [Nesterenkonia alba]|uniref:HAD family hydrolase n=1 Tax=Nesterenkonia alba TaxID=515814 RepID=UPI0003B79D76|nr:HAD family phosphatase [Nesterenkonia alba]
MSELQAVFWDMDGTLVDTEPYWIAAEYELVAEHGGQWSQQQAHQLVGQALTYSAGILQEAGVDLPRDEIVHQLMGRVIDKCAERIPWRPGARELLTELNDHGIRCALVTMSWRPLTEAVLSALPEGHLEFAITGDAVSAGKPDPEAYHVAFERMAADHPARTGEPLQRQRCIAIEDSVPGTAAAAASGLVTLAVPHYSPLPQSSDWHLAETLAGLGVSELTELLPKTPAAV